MESTDDVLTKCFSSWTQMAGTATTDWCIYSSSNVDNAIGGCTRSSSSDYHYRDGNSQMPHLSYPTEPDRHQFISSRAGGRYVTSGAAASMTSHQHVNDDMADSTSPWQGDITFTADLAASLFSVNSQQQLSVTSCRSSCCSSSCDSPPSFYPDSYWSAADDVSTSAATGEVGGCGGEREVETVEKWLTQSAGCRGWTQVEMIAKYRSTSAAATASGRVVMSDVDEMSPEDESLIEDLLDYESECRAAAAAGTSIAPGSSSTIASQTVMLTNKSCGNVYCPPQVHPRNPPPQSAVATAIPTSVRELSSYVADDDVTDDISLMAVCDSSRDGSEASCDIPSPPPAPRRRRNRQSQLRQFLLDTLNDPRYSPTIIEWIRRDDGVFRFVEPRQVALLWGQKRHRTGMTYENLSRAMRYYYSRGVMRRVADHGRLVYQFLTKK